MDEHDKLTAARGLTRLMGEALELRPHQDEIEDALVDLFGWVPEGGFPMPEGACGEPLVDIDGAPFMSEVYLYALLGKENARTLRNKVTRIAELCGADWKRRRRRMRDPKADVRLTIKALETAMASEDAEEIYRTADNVKRALEVLTSW